MTIEKAIDTLNKYYDSVLLKIHIDFLQNPKKYQNDGVPNSFIREAESVRLALDDAIQAMIEKSEREKNGYDTCTLQGPCEYQICGRKLEAPNE